MTKLINANKTLLKLTPRGFCHGVVYSWNKIIQTINKYKENNIYMLGWFVHNKNFVNKLLNENNNLFLLDDTNCTRYQLIKKIKANKNNDILILSAHGTDEKTLKLANKKFMQVIDTTCEYVTKTHLAIKKSLLNKKTKILYFGVKNHPECISCISISKKIKLIENLSQLKKLSKTKHYTIFNQTTLSLYDLYNLYKYVKTNFNFYQLNNDICNATNDRQQAIINNKDKYDLLIVVGDSKSNNSKSLVNIALNYQKQAILISSINDIKNFNLTKYQHLAITSGASTPTWITNEIINYINKSLNYEVIEND